MTIIYDTEGDRVLSRESVLVDPLLSLFQKVLLVTDGSVTELLCIYTGQNIRARKIEQIVRAGGAPAVLGCAEDAPLLHRRIMLVDCSVNLVYAESAFVLDRLSARTRSRLLETDAPIGLLWRQEKSEMYREIVDLRIEANTSVAAHFGLSEDTRLLSRTYLLHQEGHPLGIITEKFPISSFRQKN